MSSRDDEPADQRRAADNRKTVRRRRSETGPDTLEDQLAGPRKKLQRRLGQPSDSTKRWTPVIISVLDGCSENHLAVDSGHEITVSGPDHLTGHPLERAQSDDLALDRSERQIQPDATSQVAARDAGGEDGRAGLDRPSWRPDADDPLARPD